MPKTRANLTARALGKLFMVGAGQDVDPGDQEKIDNIVPSFFAFIEQADIYSVADENDIDEGAFEWLADYLAWFAAPDFSKSREEVMRQMAEYNLRRIQAQKPTYETMRAEYF